MMGRGENERMGRWENAKMRRRVKKRREYFKFVNLESIFMNDIEKVFTDDSHRKSPLTTSCCHKLGLQCYGRKKSDPSRIL